jgi:hypothetical protein
VPVPLFKGPPLGNLPINLPIKLNGICVNSWKSIWILKSIYNLEISNERPGLQLAGARPDMADTQAGDHWDEGRRR